MNDAIITYLDWLLAPFYIVVILIFASNIQRKNIAKNPIYKYFTWGLFAKIFGAIALCLIYVYYYRVGGDTLNYNSDTSVLLKLLFLSPHDFFSVWLTPLTPSALSCFTNETGYLIYGHNSNAFMVDRLVIPLKLLSFDSYLISSILMAVLSFSGVWKLYKVFCDFYPRLYKKFAIAVLFVPSVLFWGSGLLKDSWTLSAVGWFTYSFYNIFIKKKSVYFSIFTIFIAFLILVLVKPYIFIALLPGSILWAIWSRMLKIKNLMLRFLVTPIIIGVGVSFGLVIWSLTSADLGEYSSLDGMLQKATASSEDLKQDYYQGNSFDIGSYDPTLSGVFSKFPIAVISGLFRPFLWETKNIVMLASGIENAIILFFVLYILFGKRWGLVNGIFSNPLVLFSILFAIFFSFSVAISTSNFGALVRLRIPEIPFLLCGLIILHFGEVDGWRKSNLY